MAHASISIKHGLLPDRRFLKGRKNSRILDEDRIVNQKGRITPLIAGGCFLCLMTVAAFTLVVYMATGLSTSVASPVGHVILAGVMFLYFLMMFSHGLTRKIQGFRYFWHDDRQR